ncbi:MAG: hypothetical protein WDZ63_04395 [Burkholderiales bacterium]
MEPEVAVKEARERITRDVLALLSEQGEVLRGAKIEWVVGDLSADHGFAKVRVRTALNSADLRFWMEEFLLSDAEYHVAILPRLREMVEDLAFLEGRSNLLFGAGTAGGQGRGPASPLEE